MFLNDTKWSLSSELMLQGTGTISYMASDTLNSCSLFISAGQYYSHKFGSELSSAGMYQKQAAGRSGLWYLLDIFKTSG